MEKVYAICALIRAEGCSDGAAGARVGVPHTTLSRWKAQNEDVVVELVKARALYQAPRLQKIEQARRKDGTLDWRAQAWLVKFAAPDQYGRPSRRRRLRDVVISEEEMRAETISSMVTVSTPPSIPETKSVTFSPEIPATAEPVEREAAKSVAFSPEIPSAAPRADLHNADATKSVTISPEMAAPAMDGADSGRRLLSLAA
jgi:hypothetical protein